MNKVRKMQTAAGGPIQKQKYNYLNEAILFAENYRNSPGFKERWSRIGKVPGTYRIKNSKYNPLLDSEHKLLWKIGPFKKGNYIPWKEDPKNSMYKYGNGDFYIGTSKKPGDAFSNWKDVLTHEAGHYLEESLNNPTLIYKDLYTTNSPLNFYSEIYPVFRKSNSYKNVLNFISGDKEDVSEYNRNPVTKSWSFNYDWGTNDLHDASPSESYADLFLLRKKLLDSGVYDVRKANNPFTKDYLEIFKKKNKDKIRLFDNFSDDDIIWMMNNVAKNNNKNLNILYNYYAKQGGKMNILEFLKNGSGIHIKEKNKGSFTRWCGGNVTEECIRRGKASSNPKIRKKATFADNARHFKHKDGGKIDFYSLGGWFKNTFNNVSNFLGSDTGKSVLSIGSGLLGLGKGISLSGEINDLVNKALEAINALEAVDRLKSFAKKYAAILLEKLSRPDIDVNGSPIHTNGVNVSNEAYNLAVNTFNFDRTKYNQMRQQLNELAKLAQALNSSSMAGSVNGLIDSIGGIAGSFWNKSTTPKTSLIITGNPDSSKQVITTNSGMSGTVNDWRKYMQV